MKIDRLLTRAIHVPAVLELDADGVIFDIWGTFFNDLRFPYAETARRLGLTYGALNDFSLSALRGNQRACAYTAFNDTAFMSSLRLFPGVNEAVLLLKRMFDEGFIGHIIIDTVVYKQEMLVPRFARLREVFETLSGYDVVYTVCVGTKQYNQADVRIEDNGDAIDMLRGTQYEAGLSVLIDAPYNRSVTTPVLRCNSLHAACRELQCYFISGKKVSVLHNEKDVLLPI